MKYLIGAYATAPSLGLDDIGRGVVKNRRSALKLRQTFQALTPVRREDVGMPAALRMLMLKASLMRGTEQMTKAASLYRDVLQQFGQHRAVATLARRSLVEILLAQSPMDLNAISEHLAGFASAAEGRDDRLWNLECRLLFRRVHAAPPAQRQAMWQQGIQELWRSSAVVAPETLADLDELIIGIAEPGPLTPGRVLTDMILMVPDLPSLQELQRRRTTTFVDKGMWAEAVAAAKQDVLLASVAAEGPLRATDRCRKVMESAGVTAADRDRFVARCWWEPGAESRLTELSDPSEFWAEVVDGPPTSAASMELQRTHDSRSDRQRAFLNAWAGRLQMALRSAHAALATTASNPSDLARAFDELAVISAVADADYLARHGFLRWLAASRARRGRGEGRSETIPSQKILAECEARLKAQGVPAMQETSRQCVGSYRQLTDKRRSELATRVRSRLTHRVIEWGGQAIRADRTQAAISYWVQAIETQDDPNQAIVAMDTILTHAENFLVRDFGSAHEFLDLMRSALPHLRSSMTRRHLLIRIAGVLYEQGDASDCLATLDQADSLAAGQTQTSDMAVGFMRALSLMRLRSFDKAIAVLEGMEAWPGTVDDHARAVFLVGWIHLQRDQKSEALQSFEQIVDRYPQTPFADNARALVHRLQGL